MLYQSIFPYPDLYKDFWQWRYNRDIGDSGDSRGIRDAIETGET